MRSIIVTLALAALAMPAGATARGMSAISSPFGPRVDPIRHEPGFHRGIDLPAPRGTPVVAAAAGVVRIAGPHGGYGILVEIEHADGSRTLYGHLSHASVAVGTSVTTGETIGLIGATGRATGPHLHFEYRIAGQAVDPLHYLGGRSAGPAAIQPSPMISAEAPHLSAFSRSSDASTEAQRLPDGRQAGTGLSR